MKPKRVLGKGLSALIPEADAWGRFEDKEIRMVALSDIQLNPRQPRKSFDDNRLSELAESITQVGVLQPVLLRRQPHTAPPEGNVDPGLATGSSEPDHGPTIGSATGTQVTSTAAIPAGSLPRYQVVAGERRVRAARLASLREIPAIICTYQETEAMKIALLENIQREDLDPLEEAGAYRALQDAYGATQEELAAMLGKSRSSVANGLRLLTLETEIQTMLEKGEISRGHAKALLGLPAGPERLRLARLCRRRDLSVRECEARVQALLTGRPHRKGRRRARAEAPEVRALRERTEQKFGSPVRIERDPRTGKGTLVIRFFSDEDLERVLEVMGIDTDLS